ncbi:hypothetical protein TYRP_016841 [Tyrophagus putrescentiae]|nr:hypothetical protein TYRP_016841 [Tyrophagus putrescentiae]
MPVSGNSTFCCSPIFSDNAHHCLALIIRMSSQLHNHPLLLQRTTTIASSLHHHRLDPNAFASLLVIYVNAAFCLGASTLLHYSILISSALLLKGDHHQWPERKGKRIARSKKLVAFRIAKLLTLLMGTVLHWGTGRRFTDLLTTTLVETNADDLKVQLASVNVTTISWHFGAVPRVLQPAQNGDHNAAHFTFEAAFLTAYHLYAFYKRNFISNISNRVRLGRLCRFSRTWQAVDSLPPLPLPSSCTTASHRELSNGRLHALPLPWAQEANDRQVMLFYGNKCLLLTLEAHTEPRGGGALAPVRTTLEQLSLLSMLSLRQEAIDGNGEANVISVEQAISTNWLQVVAQPERRAVLVLAQLAVALRQWTRLALVGDRLTGGHFMALHGGHLYIGLVSKSTMKTPGGRFDPQSVSLSLKEVLVIDFEWLVAERSPVVGELPSRATANLQANLQFVQVSDTVYALNALFGPVPVNGDQNVLGVVKNQLWALHLPSLTMQHINDGPQGGLPNQMTSVEQSSTEKSYSSFSSFSPEDYFSPLNPFLCVEPGFMSVATEAAAVCRLYRVVLGPEVPSLASIALRLMLTSGRPVRGLLVAHSNDFICSSPVLQQERTLPHLRAFIQPDTSLGRHCPTAPAR